MSQPTVPNPALQPERRGAGSATPPLPAPRPARAGRARPIPPAAPPPPGHPRRAGRPPRPRPQPRRRFPWLLLIPVLLLTGCGGLLLLTGLWVGGLYADGILPGVRVGSVALAGLDETAAAGRLADSWHTITLRDGDRTWPQNAADLGIRLDAGATAAAAYRQGRGQGDPLRALFGRVELAPVVTVDAPALLAGLTALADEVNMPPVNAGVALVNGTVQATPPQAGRQVDANATLQTLLRDPAAALAGGRLSLVMQPVAPAVTDAGPMLAQARALLQNALAIRVYDPVTGDSVYWTVEPAVWGGWLSATPDASSPVGLSLRLEENALRGFLGQQAAQFFDASRTIDVEAGIASLQQALAAGTPDQGFVTVKHQARQYTVQPGETITGIAWAVGVPYLYIVQANGGLESVSAGQVITLPPADLFLQRPVVPGKRIVISISEQRTRVYENDALKWDWVSSTGIASSPTWTGVYQVLSREENAYAGNWDLWMPWFIGVYQPVPGANFTNGFHGFPTRGGGQLLWENSLGRRVTYGCILLNNTSARLLYDWVEEGVVVEIRA
ncbi:MAG: L,D-transpeptidase family protein [Anaerolineae bacterium]|nr:L,D-transpeptidase family protein [Anaerolineae bacterium]